MTTDVEIKNLDDTTLDVFWGSGWNNWARIKNDRGFLKPLAGEKIPPKVFSYLVGIYGTRKKNESI